MAKQVVTRTEYTDDLDGSKAAGTVAFSYEGAAYEIDLSKMNAKAFGAAMAPYVAAARTVKTTRSTKTSRKRASRKSSTIDLAAVREWAAANGHDVSSRGRISALIIEAYQAAH
jgi:hypothetical protein